ncbi:type II toxin-antitoxin system PemK/MazF family toxin [Rhodobacter sp. NSM]|uniref:type II toxin-antitoxin system PemK/MazF family toxin n=1 Tax=Rhodobacter sp. NSM TaxID=3457501 RepID=UPI003FCFF028
MCNFDMGGFRSPEMVKNRPAVVLVGRLPRRDGLLTVVPLSGTPSHPECDYQCEIRLEHPLPAPFQMATTWWVKADMIATVSFQRVSLFSTARGIDGKRRYVMPKVTPQQFTTIQDTVLNALRIAR